jgi:GDPmannose 4,6-dehydratase
MNAKRDWGHAKDYIEMQWLMLQQEKPEDFVIASGEQHSVRDFVTIAAKELGIKLRWEGEGLEEIAIVESVDTKDNAAKIQPGQTIVRVDPRYFRPTEVETLLGDPSNAKNKLGWTPRTTFSQLVEEMVRCDLEEAKRDALCRSEGYQTFSYNE